MPTDFHDPRDDAERSELNAYVPQNQRLEAAKTLDKLERFPFDHSAPFDAFRRPWVSQDWKDVKATPQLRDLLEKQMPSLRLAREQRERDERQKSRPTYEEVLSEEDG